MSSYGHKLKEDLPELSFPFGSTTGKFKPVSTLSDNGEQRPPQLTSDGHLAEQWALLILNTELLELFPDQNLVYCDQYRDDQ